MQRMAAKNGLKAMAICVRSIAEVIMLLSELHTEYHLKTHHFSRTMPP